MKKDEYKKYIKDFRVMISPFEDYYFRDPSLYVKRTKSNNLEKIFMDFIDYVFVQFNCDKSFKVVWYKFGEIYFKFLYNPYINKDKYLSEAAKNCKRNINLMHELQFFFSQVSGGSIYKECFKGIFTKKETALIIKPKNKEFDIYQNMVFAIAFQHSKNFSKSSMIASSRLSIKLSEILGKMVSYDSREKFLEKNYILNYINFIRSCVVFFANIEADSLNEIDEIIDFLFSEYRRDNSFSPLGKKYTIETIRKKTKNWHRELRRIKVIGNIAWDGHPIEDSKYQFGEQDKYREWSFIQIKKGKDLAKEGTVMRHCVFSYKNGCINGDISIWSVRLDNKRTVTIELKNNGEILQAKGKANRNLKPVEKEIIHRWCNDNFLRFDIRC